jgi:hypothetical protein
MDLDDVPARAEAQAPAPTATAAPLDQILGSALPTHPAPSGPAAEELIVGCPFKIPIVKDEADHAQQVAEIRPLGDGDSAIEIVSLLFP